LANVAPPRPGHRLSVVGCAVHPRGVTLAGIDSVMCPKVDRLEAWRRLAADLDPAKLDAITTSIKLSQPSNKRPISLPARLEDG
jgi:hypothetical protein